MQKIVLFLLLAAGMFLFSGLCALAQSSLGIGVAEPVITPSGPFARLLLWIHTWQSEFERVLSKWLIDFHHHPQSAFWLVMVSLGYGVLHAVGPGHGKAVVSSYLIANNETLRRGILLSFVSSLLQAITAISLVLIAFFLLPARLTQTANWLTNASFALIMLLGLWLLIRKTPALFAKSKINAPDALFADNRPIPAGTAAGTSASNIPNTDRPRLNWKKDNATHQFLGNSEVCTACGESHILSPELISAKTDWKSVLPAILSIGLRPCTGAVFVMSFAVLNGLTAIGCLSVIAMSLGTFVTVSALAALAVNAKRLMLKMSGRSSTKFRLQIWMEWCAALFIFVSGFLLFASALY